MMRVTTIVIAFLLIIQSLEEEHVLVYAHEGREAGHKSLAYHRDQDSSKQHPQVLYEFAPRKLRSGRTTRAEKKQETANNNTWSFKMLAASKDLTESIRRPMYWQIMTPLRFHTSCKKTMTIVNDLANRNSLSRLEPSTSAKDIKKLARFLRSDYPTRGKPRREPPINNRAPDMV
ncbi:hypothetical protein CARUB_v10019071mg [Capsella rubella]|uniref:Uncharacterized protein n=1 Tax=Capsella rubella TaxID=81985 RepID=R0HP23_9BRAS|nr:hypothetical protein CARUB_v10019071mg [Capsella rubella]